MAPLPTADQRYLWLRLRGFDSRDEAGSGREIEDGIYWGEGAEFLSTCRMSDTMMDLDAAGTLCFQLGGFRRRMSWRQFILALGLQTEQEMAEGRFGDYWAESDRLIPDKGDLRDYWLQISSDRDFLGPVPSYAPEKVTSIDLFYLRRMDHGTVNVPHLLAQYLFRYAEGRKSIARLSGGHFIGRLAAHFGLVSDEGLRGLQVVSRELPLIDLHELGRLHISTRYGDTLAWVAPRPERQQVSAAGASEADEAGKAAEEVAPEIPAPAPAQAPPPAPQPHTISQRMDRLKEELMDTNGQTYDPFDTTLAGSSGLSIRRRVRPRTGEASTSAATHTDAQPDP
ncbi:hypothetical protein Tco_1178092, partial [Tanacetum coccineum]